MKISFGICVHNEEHYIRDLLRSLLDFIEHPATKQSGHEYEIVIVDDYSTDKLTTDAVGVACRFPYVRLYFHQLNGDFATHKNFLIEQCTGDWILNLDADESLPEDFLANMTAIIDSNPNVEAYKLPRVNTVDGLTLKHVQKWGWSITSLQGFRTAKAISSESEEYALLKGYGLIHSEENGFVTFDQPIVCWPDPQMRLFKRASNIRWVGRVHETLTGFDQFAFMPVDPDYAIRHHKEIARQEQQNNLYDTIQR